MAWNSYTETSLAYDPARCINCKRCTQVCPHGVFAAGTEHVELSRPESCMECGACALNCPVKAISVDTGVGCASGMITEWFRSLTGRRGGSGCC